MIRRSALSALAMVVLVAAGIGVASSLGATKRPTVKAVRAPGYGKLLVTSTGLTLYRFTEDTRGSSTCSGACARLWPPLLVKGKQKPVAGLGLKASKLGTIKRGSVFQVTFGGFALYRYAADRKPGDVNGQGVEGTWFVVSSAGKLIRKTTPAVTPPPPTETTPPPPTETTPPPPPPYDYG